MIYFLAQTFGSGEKIDSKTAHYFTEAIGNIVKYHMQYIDTTGLEKIIIPEDFKEALFTYQKSIGKDAYMSEHKYAVGLGQLVSDTTLNQPRHVIFLRKDIMQFLLPEAVLVELKKNIEENAKKEIDKNRAEAMYLIHHEIAHIPNENTIFGFSWLKSHNSKHLDDQYITLAISIWGEYFACRSACNSRVFLLDELPELFQNIHDIEDEIIRNRIEYNMRRQTLDSFRTLLSNRLKYILKAIASYHGHLYQFDTKSREQIIQNIHDMLSEQKAQMIWQRMGRTLNNMFIEYPQWKNVNIFSDIISLIITYINSFGVYISEREEGIYYDIPCDYYI